MRSSFAVILAATVGCAALAAPPEPDPIPLPLPPPSPKPAPKATPIPLKAPKTPEQPTPAEAAAIAKLMREMLLQKMPDPMLKSNDGWGKQKEFAVGKVILRRPERVDPELPRQMVNDGLWRRFTVTARDPDKTLGISFADLTRTAEDKLDVTLIVAMDINFRMEQQLWKRGHELYSGETRGHCQGAVRLKATVVHKTEFKPGQFLPEIALTITTTEAKLWYDKLVIDHTAGLDGEDAKKVGDLVIGFVKDVAPDLEKQLLEKGGAAIVKAAGTKEIKLQLDKLVAAGVVPKK